MADLQHFRSAFRGFNRQDVVNYIEFMNQKHNSQIEQLNTQLQNAREELRQLKATPATAQVQPMAQETTPSDTELEAYRRAERAERKAQERAAQIYAQANAVLADATGKVESVSDELSELIAQVAAKLQVSKEGLRKAVDAMYAIRPEEE